MPAPSPCASRHFQRGALALRLLFWGALLLRLWFVVISHSPRDFIFSDMQSYHAVAIDLLLGRSSPWHAFRPVGYSLLLSAFYALSDGSGTFVGVVQAVMGAALVPLTAELARVAGCRPLTVVLCGAAVALSVPLTLYCGLLLTELPSCFFLLVSLTRVLRALERQPAPSEQPRDAVHKGGPGPGAALSVAGMSLGVAAALRPNLLILVLVLAPFVWWHAGQRLRSTALLTLCLALPVLAVSAYNSALLGRPVGPATNGGLNFYLNFADVRTLQYQGAHGGYWISPVPNGFHHTRHELTEVPFFEERHYYARGLAVVLARPAVLLSALDNFVEAAGVGRQLYWPNWPGHELLLRRYAWTFFALVLLPACCLLLSSSSRRVRRGLAPAARLLLATCVMGSVPTYFFLGDPRVRVPFDPLWVVLSGLALQRLLLLSTRVLAGATSRAGPALE